jgi:hypothetical protein
VIDVVTAPKRHDMSEPQIQENLAITSAALGTFIPIIRGRQIVKGNVIDATQKQAHTVTQDTGGGGGKGGFGGQQQVNRTTTYSVTLAIGLCAGPITRISKFWTDATLVYDENQMVGAGLQYHIYSDMEPPKVGLRTQNACTDIHLYRGTETQAPSTVLQDIHGASVVQAYRGLAYVVIKDLDLGTSGRVPQFQFEIIGGVSNNLADVVVELCDMAGINTALVDVSLMPVRNVDFLIAATVAASAILETLAVSYSFIGVESDGKIKFRSKSIAPSTTVPENLLSGGIDHQNTTSLSIVRMQDRELPTQVTVTYPDKDRNFQSGAQIQQLTNVLFPADAIFQVNVPVGLWASDAKILAESILYEAWSSRESFTFTLPPRYMVLEPGDALVVDARGVQYNLRITEWTQGDNWLAEVKGVSYDASVHAGFHAVPGVTGTGFVALRQTALASAILIEPPAMSTSDVEPRWLFAAYSQDTVKTFVSGTLFESLDGGASYNFLLNTTVPAIVGTVAAALPAANWYVWDTTNTIVVTIYQRALQSGSDLEVLNGKNWAMLGGELIAFCNALLIGPRTYRLSRLLRGRKGTENYVGAHGTNEPFVLVTPELRANQQVGYARSRINATELYKVIDPLTNISLAAPFAYTPQGISVKPYAPVVLPLVHHTPSTNDITISWLYRSRTHGELINSSGIAWDIDFSQQFYVNIYNNSGYGVVVRSILSPIFADPNATLSLVYTAAQQVADFGAPQATVYIDVYGVGTGIQGYSTRMFG